MAGQRRRDRHGEPPIGAVAFEAVHHFEERDVGLGDGLVEPVFFEKIVVFGMAHVGQMGVQDQAKITEWHGNGSTTRSADLPGVRLPVMASKPSASAPLNVSMRRIAAGSTSG